MVRHPRVLIPSSSGQCFKRNSLLSCRSGVRLNPFFIRAMFQTERPESTPVEIQSLNPFFIRAMFQTEDGQALGFLQVLIPSSSGQCFKLLPLRHMTIILSLNPFFIRAMFQTFCQNINRYHDRSLNPFFIRAMFQTHKPPDNSNGSGLNPFFIRAMFQTPPF